MKTYGKLFAMSCLMLALTPAMLSAADRADPAR